MSEAAEAPDYNRSSGLLFFGYGGQFCLETSTLGSSADFFSLGSASWKYPERSVSCADPDKAMAN